MHPLCELCVGVRSLSSNLWAVEIPEIEPLITIVRFDQAARPQTKVATSVCVNP